jgi:hypothetical protein
MIEYARAMATRILRRSVLARELPDEWRRAGAFAPDERVTVLIEPEAADRELAAAGSLVEVMDIIGRRASARGLSEAKLREILGQGR